MLDFIPLRLPRVIKLSSTWSAVTRKPSLDRSGNISPSNLINSNRKRINNLLVFLGRASHGHLIERISGHKSPRMTSNRTPSANKNLSRQNSVLLINIRTIWSRKVAVGVIQFPYQQPINSVNRSLCVQWPFLWQCDCSLAFSKAREPFIPRQKAEKTESTGRSSQLVLRAGKLSKT